jgi:hypothetical protein
MRAQSVLALALAGSLLSLLSIQFFQPRYAWVLLPFMVLWAAAGLDWVSRTLGHRLGGLRFRLSAPIITATVGGALATSVLLLAGRSALVQPYDEWGESKLGAQQVKTAGLWLATQAPAGMRIMDAASAIPYYARADGLALPYASKDLALRYIDYKAPDYVVLRGALGTQRPYLTEWVENGIPQHDAQLVYDTGGATGERIRIYKWK